MKKILFWIPFIIYSLVLIRLLLTPSQRIPPSLMSLGDHVLHLTAFAGLKFFYFAAVSKFFRYFDKSILFVLLSIFYLSIVGGILELLQLSVPGRKSSWIDFFCNILGLFVGLILSFAMLYLVRRWREITVERN